MTISAGETMAVRFGVFVPQGWRLDPVEQFEAITAVAKAADEDPAWDSIWIYDHFHTVPRPELETTFQCWTSMATLARHQSGDHRADGRLPLREDCVHRRRRQPRAGTGYVILYAPRVAYDHRSMQEFASKVISQLE